MFADFEVAGKQFKAEKGAEIRVPLLDENVGAKVVFEKIFLISGKEIKIGTPTVENAKVNAKVLGHGKDKKIIVFKKKRRKGYKVKQGHRQDFTEILINSITQ